jgi:uncharacterized protein (DUF3084 family)
MNDRQYSALVEDLNLRMRTIETKRSELRKHEQELEFISEELDNCNRQSQQLLEEIGRCWPDDKELHASIVEGTHIVTQTDTIRTDFLQVKEDALHDQFKALYLEEESINKQREELKNKATADSRAKQDIQEGSQ